ncbi:unnamed protein product, partial [Adineta steineri]
MFFQDKNSILEFPKLDILLNWFFLDALNRDSLDLIERCIFIVCLDQCDTNDLDEDDETVDFNKTTK